jgi:protein-S-isoprenylcysteine O-methyltransferase Ste14
MKPPDKPHTFNIRINTPSSDLSLWWLLKVICGLLLVTNQVFSMKGGVLPYSFALPLLLSQLLVFIGGGLFLIHFYLLKRVNRRFDRPAQLITEKGLFPWIRHPMYFGEMMLDIGLASFALHPVSVAVLLLALTALYKQALHEDRYLSRHFGDDFLEWEAHTWLVIPFVR